MLVTTLQLLPLHLFIWGLLEDSFFAAFLPKDFSFAILLLLFVEGFLLRGRNTFLAWIQLHLSWNNR